MAVINGTINADTLVGTIDPDVIDGGEGADKITAGGGNDILSGGGGNDNLNGELGDDKVYGGAGNDSLNGSSGNDELWGDDGNDRMFGGGDHDKLYGGVGNDYVAGDGGNDTVTGNDGDDTLYGGSGNDTLEGGAGNDIMNGDAGDDVLVAGPGADTLNGGAGLDSVVLDLASSDVTAAFRADVAAYDAWMQSQLATFGGAAALAAQTTGSVFSFASLGISMSLIEGLTVRVDGANVPLASFLNQAPTAEAVSEIATDEDTPVEGLVVATDADGDALSWTLGAQAANGTVELDGSTGHFIYTPGADFNGADSFSVTITDSAGHSVTQSVAVAVAAVNDAPVASSGAVLSTQEDVAVGGQMTVTDADGEPVSFALSAGPAHGLVTLNVATGVYEYTPAQNFSGSDAFEITASDASGASVTQRIEAMVAAVVDTPSMVLDSAVVIATAPVSADETLAGGDGNDSLMGGQGNDRIAGGQGNDALFGDGSPTVTVDLPISSQLNDIDGSESLVLTIGTLPEGALLSAGRNNGDGTWTLAASEASGLRLTLPAGQSLTLTVTATATEAAGGSQSVSQQIEINFNSDGEGSDTIIGGTGNDSVHGGGGDDVIYGDSQPVSWAPKEPSSSSSAAADDDVVYAGAGDDTVYGGNGDDQLFGEADNDELSGGKGNDLVDGGEGDDRLKGDSGDDVLEGGAGNDDLAGGSGNDTLDGGSGNDALDGGSGDDLLIAGAGDDAYKGGSGFDTLDYSASTGPIAVDISKKTVTGFDNDTFDGIEHVVGSSFGDTFKGSSGSNSIDGGAGDDVFRGLGGADEFTGGEGADTWQWYAKDVLDGHRHLGVDTITDFSAGDRLDLTEFTKAFKNAPIDSIVHVTDNPEGSMVSVKIGAEFVDLVMLQDVHGVGAGDLLADGMLLA